jgi:large subunit ribosomal protein L19
MNVIDKIEKDQMEKISAERSLPEFGAGDTLKVDVKIVEGDKERVQAFEGLCIARSGGGLNESFTVRKISYGEGVERIFPIFSPKIAGITVLKRGKVRRAKLYYLRDRRGKSARIVENIQVSKKEIKPKSDNKKVTEEAASKD